jgi:hypothetical protein
MHNEELHGLYTSPKVIRVIRSIRTRLVENVARMGRSRNIYKALVWKPEIKRLLGKSRSRQNDNIKVNIK